MVRAEGRGPVQDTGARNEETDFGAIFLTHEILCECYTSRSSSSICVCIIVLEVIRKCSPAAAVVAPRPFVCALSCWKCSPAPTLGDIYRPVYEIQGSRHKFLAAQPHMPRADAPGPVHGMEV